MNRATRRATNRGTKGRSSETTFDNFLREAIDRHRAGALADAERAYLKVLAAAPHHVAASHFLGVLRHQQGRTAEGIALVERALAQAPGYADAWSNLGNLFKESDRLDDAEAAFRRALALDERHAAAWNNLAMVLRARGHAAEAVELLRNAVGIRDDFADAHFNLANALRECRLLADAISAYRKVLALAPGHARAHYRLGYTLYMTGAQEEAAEVFRHWRHVEPHNPIPAHMVAACSGDDIPARASNDYVRDTFDSFAASFDDVLLHRLDYAAPQRLLDALSPVLMRSQPLPHILDAGCGTGLCGPLLKPYACSLSGVDLSPGMLAKARTRNVYDELHEDEITSFLAARPASFDVIASADTLCYFGELQPLIEAARRALKPGGWIAFTVERDDEVAAFRLQPHGRYCHATDYVHGVLTRAGFGDIHAETAVLRRELGSDVHGTVLRARAP